MSVSADSARKQIDQPADAAATNDRKKPSQAASNGEQRAAQPVADRDTNQFDNMVAIECECVDLIPKPLDGGYGWVVCLAAMSLNCILDGIGYAFSVFIPSFQEAFVGASKADVAWIGALLGGVYMLSGPIASALVNKFGCRLVTMSGALFTTVSFLAASRCETLLGMITTFGILGGFGFGLIYLPSIVCVGHYFEKKRALATGLTVCGSGIGMFVFAPLSEFLLSTMDLRNAIIWLAGIVLQCVWLGALLVPLEKKQPSRRSRRCRIANHAAKQRASAERELPRAKNVLDRIRERLCFWCIRPRSERSNSCSSVSVESRDDIAAVQKAKEARQALCESESMLAKRCVIRRHDSITNADGAVIGGYNDDGESEPVTNVPNEFSSTPTAVNAIVDAAPNTSDASASAVSPSPVHVSAHNVSMKSTPAKRAISLMGTPSGVGSNTLERPRHRPRSSASASASYAPSLRVPSATSTDKPTATATATATAAAAAASPSHASATGSATQREADEALRSTLECLSSISHLQKVYDAQKVSGSPSTKLHKDVARPLYRQDIFYSGSIVHIDKYQRVEQAREQRPEAVPVHAYTASVICIPMAANDQPDSAEKADSAPTTGAPQRAASGLTRFLGCFPKPVADVLAEMLNFNLLRIRAFSLILVGNLFAMFGFIIPFMYLVDLARGLERPGVAMPPPSLLLTFTGVTNTVGRVLCGWVSSQPQVNGLLLHNLTLTIAGVLTALVPLLRSYMGLAVYAFAYGFFISPFICLTSVILCDVVGVEALTNSFGLLCLVRGIVTIGSSPFAGFLYDLTSSYTFSFLVSAGALLIGALCHFLLHIPALQTDRMKQQIARRRELAAEAKMRGIRGVARYTQRDSSVSSASAIEVYHEDPDAVANANANAIASGERQKTSESNSNRLDRTQATSGSGSGSGSGDPPGESGKLLAIQEERAQNNHSSVAEA